MNEPTKEQIVELWEWCGWSWWEEGQIYCFGSDTLSRELPPMNLDNLFKYVVLEKLTEVLDIETQIIPLLEKWIKKVMLEDEDPTLSLLWILEKARREIEK